MSCGQASGRLETQEAERTQGIHESQRRRGPSALVDAGVLFPLFSDDDGMDRVSYPRAWSGNGASTPAGGTVAAAAGGRAAAGGADPDETRGLYANIWIMINISDINQG